MEIGDRAKRMRGALMRGGVMGDGDGMKRREVIGYPTSMYFLFLVDTSYSLYGHSKRFLFDSKGT
jgi:hypothetical protein